MKKRWIIGLVSLVALAAAATVASLRRPHRPNVLVIVWDTARADHLSLYGYHRPTTPRLDAFAKDAAVFEAARSPGIWTLPSHASMFTGLPPESHGADERWLWLDDRFLTAAEHFRDNGYATYTFAANSLLCEETNLIQGFDVRLTTYKGKLSKAAKAATHKKILQNDRSNELAPGWAPPAHGATNAEWGRAVYKEAAPLSAKTFLEWLRVRKTRDQPFFAFINLMEAHTPRIPSMEARQSVLTDDPALVDLGLQTDAGHINLHFYNFGKYDLTERQLQAISGVYDAALWDLDAATGELMDEMAALGVLDDTIVVMTSDHGENLGDHHLFNHRFSLWDSLAHVPLVVRYPKEVAAGRITKPVSTLNLFATVARLAGLSVPPGISAEDWFDDTSPMPITRLAKPLAREIETVRSVYPDVAIEPWLKEGHAIVDGERKLITLSDGTRSLYDLRNDPGETSPLTDVSAIEPLSRALDTQREHFPPYDPAARGPRDTPAHVRADQGELCKELEAMGYVTGGCPEAPGAKAPVAPPGTP